MIAGTVFNELVETLRNDSTLSEYVKFVFKGAHFNIEPDSLPCLMCEVTGNNEIYKDFNQIKKIWLDVDILAFIQQPHEPEYAIVSNKYRDYQGILDVENDIRAVLQSSYTLSDNVEDVRFDPTEFEPFEVKNTIARGMRIPVRILYRQVDGV